MEQPTKEQIEQFWKHFGLSYREVNQYSGSWIEWEDSKGIFIGRHCPRLNLENIFEYAIPKLQSEGYQIGIICWEQKGFKVSITRMIDPEHRNNKSSLCEDDELGLALFGAIWEVIK